MRIRVGINGMGRIGRDVPRSVLDRAEPAFEVVAINDLAPPETIAYLLGHDSTYGRWNRSVELTGDVLTVDEHTITTMQRADPALLDWAAHRVDVASKPPAASARASGPPPT
jgi:glyceraldehyde 3-phosphate dehydrogenase